MEARIDRAVLVGRLAGVRIEGRKRDAVHLFVVHRSKDLPDRYAGGDHCGGMK